MLHFTIAITNIPTSTTLFLIAVNVFITCKNVFILYVRYHYCITTLCENRVNSDILWHNQYIYDDYHID